MIKVITIVTRRPDISEDDFRREYEIQAQIVQEVRDMGLKRYVQNVVLPDPQGGEPPYNGIAELWFENMEVVQKVIASPNFAKAAAHLPAFVDDEKTITVFVEEKDVI